ncbi:MAG: hypothetical protein PHC55_11940 [Bacteroidales bacterium]|jgi:hypothetical protein|nr:hypothetical protein [Bacteroidales bacterium]
MTNIFSHQVDKKKLLHNDLTVQLSSRTDTCYYSDDKIVISIEFKNNGLSSLRINKNMPVTTKDIHERDAIKVNICHDGKFYEYAFLDGKEAMPRKYKLSKDKSLYINDIINFRQLVTITNTETITNISTSKIDNKDFGVYQLQALYIMNTNDTIFSNWITINYLK